MAAIEERNKSIINQFMKDFSRLVVKSNATIKNK